ncbi:hypothetical protein BDZ89DRAFT_1139724 [Hymenopellis radicata]|nr:hypothetical protein BDZ89DRAFT_1139724 [Hymenopellis radicata]
MTRAKANAGKRGRKSWIADGSNKLAFFAAQKSGWETASEAGVGHIGQWGRTAAIRYHIRYGHLSTLEDDLDHVPEIPTDKEVQDWETAEGIRLGLLSEADSKVERENLKKFGAKIVAWFRARYLNTSKEAESIISAALSTAVDDGKPRRRQVMQMFTSLHTDDFRQEITDAFDKAVTDAGRAHAEALKTDPNAKPIKVECLTYQRAVMKAHYEVLDDAEKENIRTMIEERYQAELKEWEAMKKTPEEYTPEQVENALRQGAAVLQNSADSIHKKFKMACSILLCGPADDGELQVFSVHAGKTFATNLTWPDAVPAEFTDIEKSFISFAKTVYPGSTTPDPTTAAIPTKPVPKPVRKPVPGAEPPISSSLSTSLKAVEDAIPSRTTRSRSAPNIPVTPVLRPTQVLGPFITTTLKQLVDEDRRQCMAKLRCLCDGELEREDNMLRNFLLLRQIDDNGTFEKLGELPPRGVFAGMRKKSAEELEEEMEHEEEAERMRVDMETDNTILGDTEDDVHMDYDTDVLPLSLGDQDSLKALEPPLPDPSAQRPSSPPPSSLVEAGPVIVSIAEEKDDDVEDLDWDADIDTSNWYPGLIAAVTAFKRGRVFPRSWAQLVDSFIVFETKSGLIATGNGLKLDRSNRPPCIADFFQHRRDWSKPRSIGLLPTFREFWWAWWKANQPPARLRNGELIRDEKVEWTGLQKKCGNDGLILVLGTLLWWGEVVFDGVTRDTPTSDQVDWQLAVDDVTWCIEHIVRTAVVEVPGAKKARSQKRVREDKENIDADDSRVAKGNSLSSFEDTLAQTSQRVHQAFGLENGRLKMDAASPASSPQIW